MNKNALKICSYILVAIIALIVGFLLGKSFNKTKDKTVLTTEKISVSTIGVSQNDDAIITTSDIIITENMLETFRDVINSNSIKSEIKKQYSGVKDIELEQIYDTGAIRAIYICDEREEQECIDINNKYIEQFIKNIGQVYNVNVVFIDKASISTRVVEE